MKLERRSAILDALVQEVPATLTEFGVERDVCILSSWLGRKVLAEYGILAKPVGVRCWAINRQLWEFADGDPGVLMGLLGGRGDVDGAEAAGAFARGIGFSGPDGPGPGRWDGHLILTVRNPDCLIDLTLDQGSEPERGLPLEPMRLPTERAEQILFERGERPLALRDQDSGAVVIYVADLTLDHRAAADWHDISDGARIESALVRALRERVDARLQASVS